MTSGLYDDSPTPASPFLSSGYLCQPGYNIGSPVGRLNILILWIMVLTEALKVGKAHPYFKYMSIPVRMYHGTLKGSDVVNLPPRDTLVSLSNCGIL
jgi:hypothetical protein